MPDVVPHVGMSFRRYERLKAHVSSSETAKALEAHEQKIRHYEQSIFSMRECMFCASVATLCGSCRSPFSAVVVARAQ